MSSLTQDDFLQGYTNLESYPKIVNWSTDQPLRYRDMQISVTILQRKEDGSRPWECIATLKPSSISLSTSDDAYGSDPYMEDSDVLLEPEYSFDDALDAVVDKANELIRKYYY